MGSNGNVLRWAAKNEGAQIFILVSNGLAHDANYQAPWAKAGFNAGRQISDDIFRSDMMKKASELFKHSYFETIYGHIVAEFWYKFVATLGGNSFAGNRPNMNNGAIIHEKGGAFTVANGSLNASVDTKVTYTSKRGRNVIIEKNCQGINVLDVSIIALYNGTPQLFDGTPLSDLGKKGVQEVTNSKMYLTAFPISVGAKDIKVEVKVNGQVKFSKTYSSPPMTTLVVEENRGNIRVLEK